MVLAFRYGGRGEVVNAPDCGSGIREFDSHRPPQVKNNSLYGSFFVLYENIIYESVFIFLDNIGI